MESFWQRLVRKILLHKWRTIVRVRFLCLYWKEQTAHLYSEGGAGRKRDREEFEADCIFGI